MRRYRTSKLSVDKAAIEHLCNIETDLSERNMTIAELSRQLGLDRRIVYQWVVGRCFPIPDNYNKLAEFFGWEHFMKGENQ